ncbi:MAG: riboflavin biosynthesis protein RibF [Oscillospiraceae bacterium]|nr:riboflavin biosynthesis protein RibF [Oscillospiraceae bacterium]
MDRHIALGFFDGVHRGHGALLSLTARAAGESGGKACALTFDAHPEALISGHRPPLLTGVMERSDLMRRLYGMEEIIILPFDETLMRMPWDVFLREVLEERFGASHIVAGHDFHFGYRGLGNADNLRAGAEKRGIRCDIVPPVRLDGITVSSTYIRGLVAQGDMERAARFLGHPHTLYGRVRSGQRIGSGMGFPTANLPLRAELVVPAKGVYVSRLHIEGEDAPRASMTNVGVRPTVALDSPVTAETYIFDFDGSIYDKAVRVELLTFLRPERVFSGLEALYGQIRKDAEAARAAHGAGAPRLP